MTTFLTIVLSFLFSSVWVITGYTMGQKNERLRCLKLVRVRGVRLSRSEIELNRLMFICSDIAEGTDAEDSER